MFWSKILTYYIVFQIKGWQDTELVGCNCVLSKADVLATDFSGGQDVILSQGTVEWNGMVIYTDTARGVVNEEV